MSSTMKDDEPGVSSADGPDMSDLVAFPCPRCGEEITGDTDWQRHHSLRGRLSRNWRRYVSRWLVR